MTKQYHVYALLVLLFVRLNRGKLLHIEDFYSHSFVPDGMKISYYIYNYTNINYNLTIFMPFSGKLLLSIFQRRLGDTSAEKSQTILKYKNLDFCKSIETIKSYPADNFNATTLMQSTFIVSCPLNSGFYYIINGTIDDDVVPSYFDDGWYWINMELVQVFDEVIKLLNIKFKIYYEKIQDEIDNGDMEYEDENENEDKIENGDIEYEDENKDEVGEE